MRIICITGKAGSGKDTAASDLKRFLSCSFDLEQEILVTHFADLVKYVAKNFCDWDGQKDEKGRGLLQTVGTNLFRKYDKDFWVDFVADVLTVFKNKWDYVIIPDTRFQNEIEELKARGFDVTTIRIVRDNYKSPLTGEQRYHESEVALDHYPVDVEVKNDGTRLYLASKMAEIANKIYYEDNSYQITFDDII